MNAWLVYYEDVTGRKSKTFNPKRYTPETIDSKDPEVQHLMNLDVRIRFDLIIHVTVSFASAN